MGFYRQIKYFIQLGLLFFITKQLMKWFTKYVACLVSSISFNHLNIKVNLL